MKIHKFLLYGNYFQYQTITGQYNYICFTVDETSDSSGRFITHLLIVALDENHLTANPSFIITLL